MNHATRRIALLAAAMTWAAPAFASEGGAQPSIFEGGIGNSIVTLIIFGGVLYILGRYAWPPLLKALQEREAQIRDSLDRAKQERVAAEKLLAEYKEQLAKANQEALAIVDEGRRDANEVRRRMQEETRVEAAAMVDRARKEIHLARDSAIKDLYDRTAELAVQVAGGIIRKELKPDDHRSLVNESLQRMTASKN